MVHTMSLFSSYKYILYKKQINNSLLNSQFFIVLIQT